MQGIQFRLAFVFEGVDPSFAHLILQLVMRKQPGPVPKEGELEAWKFTAPDAPPHCFQDQPHDQSVGQVAKRKQVYFPNSSLSDDEDETSEPGVTEDVSMTNATNYKAPVDVISDNAEFVSSVRGLMPELNVRDTIVSESNPTKQSIKEVPTPVVYLANRIAEAVGSLALTRHSGNDKTNSKKRQSTADYMRMFTSTHTVATKSKRYTILFELAVFTINYEPWVERALMTLEGKGLHCDEAHAEVLKADVATQRRSTLGLMHDEIKRDANKSAELAFEVEITPTSLDGMYLHLPKQCAEFYTQCLDRHERATELLKSKESDPRAKAAARVLAHVFSVRGKDRTEANVVNDWETLARVYSRKREEEEES